MFGFCASPCGSCSSNEVKSTYQQAFCGLSCALSRNYSPAARFLVNRDAVFLSLLGLSLQKTPPVLRKTTCCNPFSAPKPLMQDDLVVDYASAVTVCGLGAKLEDDSLDEKDWKGGLARLVGASTKGAVHKAIGFLNSVDFPSNKVIQSLETQTEIERSQPTIQEAATPTAKAYEYIFGHLGHLTGASSDCLQKMGASLGKLIYWRDAYDDLHQDNKKGRFNILQTATLEDLRRYAVDEVNQFQASLLQLSLLHHGNTIQLVSSSTFSKHQEFLGMNSGGSNDGQERKRDRLCSSLCDNCFCDMCCSIPEVSCCDNSSDGCCDGCGGCDCN